MHRLLVQSCSRAGRHIFHSPDVLAEYAMLRTFVTGLRTLGTQRLGAAEHNWPIVQGNRGSTLLPRAAGKLHIRSMFVQTQETPNPASMMFLPGEKVMETGSANFGSAREAMKSPLALKLFQVDGVTGVFFGSDFITVTKSDQYAWSLLNPEIFAAIMEHFTAGEPIFQDASSGAAASDTAIHEDDTEVVAMIKELIETRIRPSVQEDGGDISFRGFDEESGVVTLKMQGACSGCPSSSVTLKSGIENMLMHYIPEVKMVVEEEPDEAEQQGLSAFKKFEAQLST